MVQSIPSASTGVTVVAGAHGPASNRIIMIALSTEAAVAAVVAVCSYCLTYQTRYWIVIIALPKKQQWQHQPK